MPAVMNESKQAIVSEVVKSNPVWERTDVPTLHESGVIDMDYVDALHKAGDSTTDQAIKDQCLAKFAEHTRIFID
jgi:hypothetical protein